MSVVHIGQECPTYIWLPPKAGPREGQRVLPAPLSALAQFDRNAWSVFHKDGRRRFRGWAWNDPDPLPVVPWTVENGLEVLVDLGLAIEHARAFNRWDDLVESAARG